MAIIAMNRAIWEEPNGWQNSFWRENPHKPSHERRLPLAGIATFPINSKRIYRGRGSRRRLPPFTCPIVQKLTSAANSSRAANRMRGVASTLVRTASGHAEGPRGEHQSEICSSVRPRVGGPNTPTETTTTSMARAIKAKTPAVPERWKRNPIIRLVNAVDRRPQE
jgi:hypothetical protein